MSTKIVFLIFVGMSGCLAFTLPANHDIPVSANLKHVATVEGKSFFSDSPLSWNWTEAGEYCESMRMQLADITSKTQYDAVTAAFNTGDFENWGYWTAGRDAHLPRQFSWNTTTDALSIDYGDVRGYNGVQYQTCVFFWARPSDDSALYYYPCSWRGAVLCST